MVELQILISDVVGATRIARSMSGSPAATREFAAGLNEVCQSLAYQIAADGEGATKVVKIVVKRAVTQQAARAMARTIANSPLVKCAMNGNDPNWGRIVSAAGLCGVPFDPDRATLNLQRTLRPLPSSAVGC
jgi:glutamate N-acetyltransferase/amino-acid N-acetyltransferase